MVYVHSILGARDSYTGTCSPMDKVAVVHPDLNKRGGAEAVCLNIVRSLAPHYTVHLLSLTTPSVSELQAHYDMPVPIDSVFTLGSVGPWLERATSELGLLAGVDNLGALDAALVNRLARRKAADYDLIISSMSEMYFNTPSIQYIHYPNFHRTTITASELRLQGLYERVCQEIANADRLPQASATYLANSQWTAHQFERIYGEVPTVVYPPVDTSGFDPVPWQDRKEGILVVGRISTRKRLLEILSVFASLKSDGYQGTLRIVGPVHNDEYYARLQRKAESIPDVFVDGALSRSRLVTLMSTYRYAIHGKENEHFGMVIAEYVAAGMIPFLPASGGQPEIVDHDSALLYDSWSALRTQLETVIGNPDYQHAIRDRLPDIERRFGVDRFIEEFQEHVCRMSC